MFTRHLTIQFLIVNILFSNFVWAVDECGYLFDQPSEAFSMQYDNHLNDLLTSKTDEFKKIINQDDVDKSACDVNCSANIRLLYVSFKLPPIYFEPVDSIKYSLESLYHSVQGQPPVKPPRV